MGTRLTAILVAIIIGAPACWWCPMAAAAAAKDHSHHSCCCDMPEETAPAPANNSKDKKPCPCEMGQAPRDCAVDLQVVPVGSQGGAFLTLPIATDLPSWADLVPRHPVIFNDTGPPHRLRPLFQRHHAWLL